MRFRPRLRGVTWIALAMLGLAAVVVWQWPLSSAARERQLRQALLDELQPVALENCSLARFGGANDTGFLMCKNLLEGFDTAYSYGIVGNDDWGCDISTRYRVPVHQYDCMNPPRPACKDANFVFHAECLGDRRAQADSRTFDTLASHLSASGGTRVIVKIDVEGAEWDSLAATPDAVLDRIEQMPMELHGVDERRFLNIVRRLKTRFHLVNLHFNNFSCHGDYAPMPAWAYQVLWVNKRVGVLDADAPVPAPPSPLNAPDAPKLPDCQVVR